MNNTVLYMKKHISDFIYSEATIEGVGSTFEQIQNIIESGNVVGLQSYQIDAILNLKDAWQYLFNNYDNYIDKDTIQYYNYLILNNLDSEAGKLRFCVVQVHTRFHTYFPSIPTEHDIYELINLAWEYDHNVDRALCLLSEVAKKQLFNDGNKRTSQLIANHELARTDSGYCFCVPDYENDNFKTILGSYYTDNSTLKETINNLYNYVLEI